MEEQQLSSGSCSCPPFGLQAWYFVHDDYLRVMILNFNFEKSGLRKDGWTTAWWWQQLARQSPCPAEFSCKRCSLRLFQISCLVFLSPPFICYSYFFTEPLLSPPIWFFIPRILLFALSCLFFSIWQFSQSATVSWSVQRKSTMDLLTVGIEFEIMQKIKIFKQIFWW